MIVSFLAKWNEDTTLFLELSIEDHEPKNKE